MRQIYFMPCFLSRCHHIIIIFFSLVPQKSLGALDPYFQTCSVHKDCGDGLAIRFPFYIHDMQSSSCGYPRFELSCNKNGHPTILISNNNYTIQEILYRNETLRVSNSAFSNPNSKLQLYTLYKQHIPSGPVRSSTKPNQSFFVS